MLYLTKASAISNYHQYQCPSPKSGHRNSNSKYGDDDDGYDDDDDDDDDNDNNNNVYLTVI